MPNLLVLSGMLDQGLSAAKRKGPQFTPEKLLQIAEAQLAKGNGRVALMFATQALNKAKKEGKEAIARRAQEIIDIVKGKAANVAALFDSDGGGMSEDMAEEYPIMPELGKVPDEAILMALVDKLLSNRPGSGLFELALAMGYLNETRKAAIRTNNAVLLKVSEQLLSVVQREIVAKALFE